MNHTNHIHPPEQARFICQTDIFVVGSDMTGSPVMQRPWLVATIDAYSRAILSCRVILPSGINLKKSTE